MSVRKVYTVLVNGDSVFSGSYASCKFVFSALSAAFSLLNISASVTVSFSF